MTGVRLQVHLGVADDDFIDLLEEGLAEQRDARSSDDHRTDGVSVWSWGAYLVGALLWFWHGVREGDKNIYLPCVGWVLLDAAVIGGVLFASRG